MIDGSTTYSCKPVGIYRRVTLKTAGSLAWSTMDLFLLLKVRYPGSAVALMYPPFERVSPSSIVPGIASRFITEHHQVDSYPTTRLRASVVSQELTPYALIENVERPKR